MRKFLLALQFLTIIPVKPKESADKSRLAEAQIYFPLIGLTLGLILVGVNSLLSLIMLGPFLINAILVILLIILTGGLHLDGLADTFDALLSGKNKIEMLRIMRDSHIGTMGVLSLISVILMKLALLCSFHNPAAKNISLILMCVLSRYSMVFLMSRFPYAREEGKAKVFMERMTIKIFSLATAITLCCVIIVGDLIGLLSFVLVVLLIFLIGKFIMRKIGGITGDILGATNELVEVFVLFTILLLTKLVIGIA